MDQLLSALPILSLMLAGMALYVANRALAGERRVQQAYRRFTRGNKHDVLTLIDMHVRETENLRKEVLRQQLINKQFLALLANGLSHVGVVRYDAFDDMGGRLSFSAALLNEHGDGMVITAMNGRMQTRTYAKQVVDGQSTHNLSKEEQIAISKAMKNGREAKERVMKSINVKAIDINAIAMLFNEDGQLTDTPPHDGAYNSQQHDGAYDGQHDVAYNKQQHDGAYDGQHDGAHGGQPHDGAYDGQHDNQASQHRAGRAAGGETRRGYDRWDAPKGPSTRHTGQRDDQANSPADPFSHFTDIPPSNERDLPNTDVHFEVISNQDPYRPQS